jgi:hypothetical protein
MAMLNWHIESKGKGGAAPVSNYIWGRGYHLGKEDVVYCSFGNMPHWCDGDPFTFWVASDANERRGGSAARHLVLTLPFELTLPAWINLVERVIAMDIGLKPYQYAIHVPRTTDAKHDQPHAHILYCDRVPDGIERPQEMFFRRPNPAHPELGGCKKDTGGQSRQEMGAKAFRRREAWAGLQNEALSAGGHQARVEHLPRQATKGRLVDGLKPTS